MQRVGGENWLTPNNLNFKEGYGMDRAAVCGWHHYRVWGQSLELLSGERGYQSGDGHLPGTDLQPALGGII